MATGQLQAPPVFSEEGDYLSRKNDINMWQMFADLNKKKQEPAVYLTMTGRAREAIWKIPTARLGDTDELDRIFRSWTPYFFKMKVQEHKEFKEFCHFKRSSGEHFADFLIKFEKLY